MASQKLKKNSKTLSYILRHNSEIIGADLDKNGWCDVSGLEKLFTVKDLENIVSSNSKGRYEFNENKTKIRDVYGHSAPVEIERKCSTPLEVLYHGTAEKYKSNIEKEGLQPRSRLFVHLSKNEEMAFSVGERHGKPVIYKIDCKRMLCYCYSSCSIIFTNVDIYFICKVKSRKSPFLCQFFFEKQTQKISIQYEQRFFYPSRQAWYIITR